MEITKELLEQKLQKVQEKVELYRNKMNECGIEAYEKDYDYFCCVVYFHSL